MGLLIDTSVLIDAERERAGIGTLVDEFGGAFVAISSVTVSELLLGVHRLGQLIEAATGQQREELEAKRARVEGFVESALLAVPVVAFDEAIARVHARVSADLLATGTIVGQHDLIIGATALALDFAIVTTDTRSFPKIPGLNVRPRARRTKPNPGRIKRRR